ncbi:unnamed protein product [Lactuca saligna]|uniref:Zinc finger, CCHC-type n=1 Tax=Lactuca saligna TaxID=75948 RepID=A0AA35ZYZ6_LACSI|nr:unnamed protein product [Lactuca saligna]
MVKKLLKSTPRKFLHIVASLEQVLDLKTVGFEDIVGRLKAYEERVKEADDSNEGSKALFVDGGNQSWRRKGKAINQGTGTTGNNIHGSSGSGSGSCGSNMSSGSGSKAKKAQRKSNNSRSNRWDWIKEAGTNNEESGSFVIPWDYPRDDASTNQGNDVNNDPIQSDHEIGDEGEVQDNQQPSLVGCGTYLFLASEYFGFAIL